MLAMHYSASLLLYLTAYPSPGSVIQKVLDWEERFREKIEGHIRINGNVEKKFSLKQLRRIILIFPLFFVTNCVFSSNYITHSLYKLQQCADEQFLVELQAFSCRGIPFNNVYFYNRLSNYCFALRDRDEPSMN